jgi:signal transduction histidine kinase
MTEKPDGWRLQTGLAAALYVLVVAGVSFWVYWHARHEAIESVDRRLLAGAAAVRHVLAPDFHDRATASDAISAAEDERNIRELSSLAQRAGFVFLYTVVQKDGHFRLTSSSATQEELAAHKEVRYFDSYDEAGHLRAGIFYGHAPVFSSYTDRWGEFRGAFLPEITPGGHVYVSAAELETSYISTVLRQKMVESVAIAVVLLLSSLPIFLIYIRKQRSYARVLCAANDRLTREMAERKAIEKELIRAHNMESLGNLAGGVAHDFNNILAAILGHTELAMDSAGPNSPLARDLDEIRRAGERAKDLTRQILAFARKTSSEVRPVQVDPVAREVAGLIRSLAPATIELRDALHSTAFVLAEPVSLHQILMNLCTNAVQAMTETGGVLAVEAEDITLGADLPVGLTSLQPGPYVRITVADTGPGIAPEIIDVIFEPYFTTKDPGAGTGLGLAVVHGIVASLGGGITVRSTPGQGATFTVFLPEFTGKAPVDSDAVGLESLPRGTEHILVVDDEPSVALANARLLERLGYRVTTCTDSAAALAMFRSDTSAFDLVLTDMTMPDLTGDELATLIAAIKPGLPMLLCTGYSEKLEHRPPSDAVTQVLKKPFSGEELARAVRVVLDRSRVEAH